VSKIDCDEDENDMVLALQGRNAVLDGDEFRQVIWLLPNVTNDDPRGLVDAIPPFGRSIHTLER
jgi:hypothetical protein